MLPPQLWLDHRGWGMPRPERLGPIQTNGQKKPIGGMWTSPHEGNGTSAWTRWLENHWTPDPDASFWELVPDSEVRVLTIYGRRQLHLWGHSEMLIDFPRAWKCFDAVYFTPEAVQEIDHGRKPENEILSCESVFWLRWKFSSFKQIQPATQASLAP